MTDLDLFASLRPPDEAMDPAVRAGIRAALLESAAVHGASGVHAVTTYVRTAAKRSTPERGRRCRVSAAVAVAAALLVVLGLVAISARPRTDDIVVTTQHPQVAPDVTAATSLDAVGVEETTAASTTDAAAPVDSGLPPGVSLPEQIAVFDPGVLSEDPIRPDPIQEWLSPDWTFPKDRWFVRRGPDAVVSAGVAVTTSYDSEWFKTYSAGEPLDLGSVAARIVEFAWGRAIAWTVDSAVRVVTSRGDVERTELVEIARNVAVAATVGEALVPAGFSEVTVPEPIADVEYDNSRVSLSLAALNATITDLDAMVFMGDGTPEGPVTAVPALNGYFAVVIGGRRVLSYPYDDHTMVTISAPETIDVVALADSVRFVPIEQVSTRAVLGLTAPADAVPRFGEISKGRWVAHQYTGPDGRVCFHMLTSWTGGGSQCAEPATTYCRYDISGGAFEPTEYLIVVTKPLDVAEVSFDGQPVDSTIELSQGYTFVFGPAPDTHERISITTAGQPVCPSA